jgi:hypothetical protein
VKLYKRNGKWVGVVEIELAANPRDVLIAIQRIKRGLNIKEVTQMFDVNNREASDLLYFLQLIYKVKPEIRSVGFGRHAVWYAYRSRPPQVMSSDSIARKHERKRRQRAAKKSGTSSSPAPSRRGVSGSSPKVNLRRENE